MIRVRHLISLQTILIDNRFSFVNILSTIIPSPCTMEGLTAGQLPKLLQRLSKAEKRAELLKLEVKDIRSQIALLTADANSLLGLNGNSQTDVLRTVCYSNNAASTSDNELPTKRKQDECDNVQNKKFRDGFMVDNDYVVVYIDGACENNGKANAKAGIGVWFGDNNPLNISKPVDGKATNNTAEIQAACQALCVLEQEGVTKVKLFTDSQFTINCITKWIKKWKVNSWKLVSGGPVKNKEELQKLDNMVNKFEDVQWIYVAGHKGIKGNEEADKLARDGAMRYHPLLNLDKIPLN